MERTIVDLADIGHGDVEVRIRGERTLFATATVREVGGEFLGVWNVFTSVHHRGEGYGRRVMEAVIEHATNLGRSLDLHVYADNIPAVRLYQSLGFTIERTYERDSYRFTPEGSAVHCIGPAHRMIRRIA